MVRAAIAKEERRGRDPLTRLQSSSGIRYTT